MRRWRLLLLPCALALSACAPEHLTQGRPWALTVPRGADATTPLPLLVLLHGYGTAGALQDLVFPFSRQVDAKQVLYALPNGTVDRVGKRFWNAHDACCDFERLPVDDVGFLRAVIADVKQQHPVDERRVFLVGHSNGAFMALRMACEASDVVTGVVSVAGSTLNDFRGCGDGAPVSVLQVHGTKDTFIPYEGKRGEFPYPGALETTRRFAQRNGCTGGPEVGAPVDTVGDATAEARREVWTGCPAGGAAELWTLDGVGHLPDFHDAWAATTVDWLLEHPR